MGQILKTILTATAVSTILSACNTSGCTDNLNSIPLAGFYSTSTLEPITLDSIGIGGVDAPNDSMLVTPGTQVSQVYLPLRSTSASTSFYFAYRGEGIDRPEFNDTLTMVYSSWPYFNSEECGASYRYTISRLDHTAHLIDSVALTDREVTNIDHEIIKIYFRTAEPEQPDTPGENIQGDRTI